MITFFKRTLCMACILLGMTAHATVKLPSFFADNMVLQQQTDVRIWGTADPGEKIIVLTPWDKRSYSVTARKDGYFEVTIKTPQAGGPYNILFRSQGRTVELRNVLFGEVWICSGQSNMEMQMKGFKAQPVEGATEELMQCQDAQLRLYYAKRRVSLTPVDDLMGTWRAADAASVRDFSAAAYFFGKALRKALGVPVGLICTAYGGAACEAWMKADWLKAFPKVTRELNEANLNKYKQRCPVSLYNGQLAPIIGYAIRGVIWYQGEDNVDRSDFYAPLFARMVEGWREEWKQGDFPFYYCQIAPYDYSIIGWQQYNSAFLREQQLKAEALIPNSRMAVLMDTGLEKGIHPRKKRQAGERMALLALSNTYGMKGLPDFAVYKDVTFQGDTAIVSFDRSKEWVYFENGTSQNFEVAGADRVFHPAEAWVSRNHVYVKSAAVKHPVAVRYAFKDWAVGDLMHDGLPVSSFRTDDWESLPLTPSKGKGDYNEPQ